MPSGMFCPGRIVGASAGAIAIAQPHNKISVNNQIRRYISTIIMQNIHIGGRNEYNNGYKEYAKRLRPMEISF